MAAFHHRETFSGPLSTSKPDHHDHADVDLVAWPFGKLDCLDHNDIRETAYEIFFTSCRSTPGFGGRHALTFYSNYDNGDGGGSPTARAAAGGGMMSPTSRVKRALGLKMTKRSPSRRMSSIGIGAHSSGLASPSGGSSPAAYSYTMPQARPRRPMTSAEIMRQQMKVSEQSDHKLRKVLMRTLVGQVGRRAETIILPLELLRHLKPSEFSDSNEYHQWQKRHLKILEAGLLLYPSIPLEKTDTFAMRLREIIRACETKAIDTGKNSDTMRTLCNSVVSLSWRSATGTPTDVCHWVDGYFLNVHIYIALLQAIFDFRDETLVLDEVDELLELIKKTWSTLGITRQIHNICFTWVLFHQYVVTAQMEPDLLCASHTMLNEVANDAKKPDREAIYVKLLSSVLNSMLEWAEKRLLHYHDYFHRGNAGSMENLLPLVLTASKILGEDISLSEIAGKDKRDTKVLDPSEDRVGHYIRSSVNHVFRKIIEHDDFTNLESKEEASEVLFQLAKETEDLALKERESFSPVLKKWHPVAEGLAAVTLHSCYGAILKQYLSRMGTLSTKTVEVLQRAGKLEKILVQMVVEDTADSQDGGKGIVREMIPYEVDSIILTLLQQWSDERLKNMKECLVRAKETETWNPKSKTEPYAHSVVELMKLAQETAEDFFNIPIGITEDLVHDLADGLEQLFQEYTTFVASCGSKQSYIPTLPPLTRCSRDSKFSKFLKKVPCRAGDEPSHLRLSSDGHNHPRPSTSRGTQRLYIRLNTLHYLLSHLNSLDKTLSLSPKIIHHHPNNHRRRRYHSSAASYFEISQASVHAACQHVSEVAAFRLIFMDSNSVFYDSLYVGDVENSRIRPALRILKQNLTLLCAIVIDKAQPLAIKEVMKASFEAFLMVMLAGGSSREFQRSDHEMIMEDFEGLKRVFWGCGEGILSQELVNREAETLEGVIELMGQCTEQLVEDFSILSCETSGIGMLNGGPGQKLPMPPTTGRWNRSDANTILRVLCHRNDRAANMFLKTTFQLAKRR